MSIRNSSQSILWRKPIVEMEEESGQSHLFKSLGLWQLTAIGVGGIIGVGIFTLAGLVANGGADA
ncbi:amino acid permease, partial [Arthrobacter deserti]|nr:amino acid permease [Arthrobacter deserti]